MPYHWLGVGPRLGFDFRQELQYLARSKRRVLKKMVHICLTARLVEIRPQDFNEIWYKGSFT